MNFHLSTNIPQAKKTNIISPAIWNHVIGINPKCFLAIFYIIPNKNTPKKVTVPMRGLNKYVMVNQW